jgi:hypothetical protein
MILYILQVLTSQQCSITPDQHHTLLLPVMGTNRLFPFSAQWGMEWGQTSVPGSWPRHRVGAKLWHFFRFLVARDGKNPMVLTASLPPSQTDSSGSIAVATWNIHNGRNGGLKSALRAMEAMDIDLGVFLETKLTGGVYTWNSSQYSIIACNAPSAHQGGIAFFWWANKMYKVEDRCIHGPNMLSFVILRGANAFTSWAVTSHQTTFAPYDRSNRPTTSVPKDIPPSSLKISMSIFVPLGMREMSGLLKWWRMCVG